MHTKNRHLANEKRKRNLHYLFICICISFHSSFVFTLPVHCEHYFFSSFYFLQRFICEPFQTWISSLLYVLVCCCSFYSPILNAKSNKTKDKLKKPYTGILLQSSLPSDCCCFGWIPTLYVGSCVFSHFNLLFSFVPHLTIGI